MTRRPRAASEPPIFSSTMRDMALALDKVRSLGEFTEQVRQIRLNWTLAEDKELWFRGEKRDYGPTRLRPTLYRPPRDGRSLKQIDELLGIENDLFQSFQRCSSQVRLPSASAGLN